MKQHTECTENYIVEIVTLIKKFGHDHIDP